MNNKTLLIVFLALLGIFLLSKLFDTNKRVKSFDTELIALDTASISSIILYPKADGHAETRLEKSANIWTVSRNGQSYPADQNAIKSLLPGLAETKVKRMVARSKDKWEQYEVTDSLGTRVKVYAGKKELADLMIGKFTFQQEPQSMTSFARRTKENDVYAIDGFLSMAYNRGLDAWRDKSFINVDPNNINKLTFDTPEGQQVIQQVSGEWMAGSRALDSLSVATYLNIFKNMNNQQFASPVSTAATHSLMLEGNNMQSVNIRCFADGGQYVLNTTASPDVWAKSDANGLFKRIFTDGLALNEK